MPNPIRITILISGGGTNLQALLDAQNSLAEPTPVEFVRVISNRKTAYGLQRAEDKGVPTAYHNLLAYKKRHAADEVERARDEYDADLAALVLGDAPDLIVCAGFMHILGVKFLEPVQAAGVDVINLHPALYGRFNGAGAIGRAHGEFMEGRIEETGVMIHYVIAEVDMGQPLLEVPIPLTHPADDDIEALEERIHGVEHKAIVQGTQIAIQNLLKKRGQ